MDLHLHLVDFLVYLLILGAFEFYLVDNWYKTQIKRKNIRIESLENANSNLWKLFNEMREEENRARNRLNEENYSLRNQIEDLENIVKVKNEEIILLKKGYKL